MMRRYQATQHPITMKTKSIRDLLATTPEYDPAIGLTADQVGLALNELRSRIVMELETQNDNTIPTPTSNPYVTRKTRVFSIDHLQQLCTTEHGISIHGGIIVIWDEDRDSRVLTFIDDYFQIGSVKPIAVREHKGVVYFLWNDFDDGHYCGAMDYAVEGDAWVAEHWYIDDDTIAQA